MDSLIPVRRQRLRLNLNNGILCFVLILVSTPVFAQSSEDSTIPPHGIQAFLDQTHLGGYGEMSYENPGYYNDVPRLDLKRIVLYVAHSFNDKWAFKSEFEVEHVRIERGTGGEVEWEQAYLDYHGSNAIGWRGGEMVLPIGITNQTHEPPTFYSVERPLFDQQVIPTTWYEIGTGFYGTITEGIEYQLYVTEGLKAEGLAMDGTDGAKQEASARENGNDTIAGSDATHPAISTKLDFLPIAGLRIGASAYYQAKAFDSLPTGGNGSFLMVMFDARFEHGPLRLRGEGGFFTVGQDGANYYGTPSKAVGGYGEVAYNILPFFSSSAQEALPFVRYESYAFTGPAPATTAIHHNHLIAGVAYKPLDNLIFKADYRFSKVDGLPDYHQLSLGGGFVF